MNYYERHLGDYAKDTGHLSMVEHGAYTLLLDRYYATEEGIPADQVYRVARARSKEERAAVDVVLKDFFVLSDGRWIKNRVEEEIQRYQESIPAAEEKKQSDKQRQRRARERRKSMFSELSAAGVVMPWNASTAELCDAINRVRSHTGHTDVTPPVTRDNTATQSPVPSPQTPYPELPVSVASTKVEARLTESDGREGRGSEGSSDPPERRLTPYAAMSIPLRNAGVKVTSMHPLLVAWVNEGFTIELAMSAVAVARAQLGEDVEIAAKYLDTILRNPPRPGSGNGHGPTPAAREREALQKLKDRRQAIGLADFRDPHEGESADSYRKAQDVAWDRLQADKYSGPPSELPQQRDVAGAVSTAAKSLRGFSGA